MGNAIRRRRFSCKTWVSVSAAGHMARKDHLGIPFSSGPYAAVAKLTESLKKQGNRAFGYWTVVSERDSIPFSHRFRTLESALPFAMKHFFSGDNYFLDGKNGGFHAWKICIPPLPPLLLQGRTRSLTPYKPRASSSSGPRKTEDQAAKRPSQNFLLVPDSPRDMPGFLCGSQATVNKLSHCVETKCIGLKTRQCVWPETLPTLSPGKCTLNGNFPTGL